MLPQATVLEDVLDDVGLGGLNEAEDLESGAAAGAEKRVDLPHLLDQGRPAATGLAGRRVVVINLDGGAVLAVGFGAEAAGLTGIETEITNQVLVGLGDLRGELGDEVQRVEAL